eukprot:GFUD01137564.1.p1 GENE.GFUD01137564.1~~GFUD01137564.1.p1  ORF type:complete len:493 (-),score=130.07 GFUD01137564.1:518-1996(-)
MKFTHICLVCVVVLASGEEHNHTEAEPRILPKTQNENFANMQNQDKHADHDHSDHDHDHSPELHLGHDNHLGPSHKLLDSLHNPVQDYKTWLAASGSILLISLCGIFGIMVIPIMQRVFYQHLIQFLIALAVGTLVGDALLHLLPHAFMATITKGPDNHDHHNHEQHSQAVWLGFVATVSMIGFFLFEKCINVLGEMKEANKQRNSPRESDKKLRVVREGHVASDRAIGENVCKNKYSNYCTKDFDLEEHPSGDDAQHTKGLLPDSKNSNYSVGLGASDTTTTLADPDHDTVIISQHEVVHHGHSHAHSHLHSAPENISSVAWMVIFGDGIHNLADGLAIGAAFADGYMSGFSTSVAVLCHELPHEIGDFAMLLKAGMTIKQAVFYNVLSSILAFIGMVAGILLGTINNFSPWMFTATAGIFLYVALVDMMPELSSGHAHPISKDKQHEGHWLEIMLQVLGMSMGVSIMLLIALYEHDLKGVFSEGHHEHSV